MSRSSVRKNRWIRCLVLAVSVALYSGACTGTGDEDVAMVSTEVGVEVASVVRATLHAWVEVYGTVAPAPAGGGAPAGAARLSAPDTGIVASVPVKEGDRVEPGTVVVSLDDRIALAEVDSARYALEFADQQMKRQRKLERIEGTSQKVIEATVQQLAAAQARMVAARGKLARVQLVSPLAGIVSRIFAKPGESVDVNTVVAEVVDPERLVATVNVPVDEAAAVEVGQAAEIRSHGFTSGTTGNVLFVSPRVDPRTASVLVRVSIVPDSSLLVGQFIHVRIVTEERPGVLAVPRAAVYTDHDGRSTLSIIEGRIARRRSIEVGLRDGELIEVRGPGVTEGATVVTLGSYALPEETKVHVLEAVKDVTEAR